MSTPVEPQTFYDIVGGHETFVASGPASTRASLADPELRARNPEEDLADAEERLRMFLEQYWGGPRAVLGWSYDLQPASRPSAPSNASCALAVTFEDARPLAEPHARGGGLTQPVPSYKSRPPRSPTGYRSSCDLHLKMIVDEVRAAVVKAPSVE